MLIDVDGRNAAVQFIEKNYSSCNKAELHQFREIQTMSLRFGEISEVWIQLFTIIFVQQNSHPQRKPREFLKFQKESLQI